MRVGIDAKWYFEGPPSGRIVVRNIVDGLLRLPTKVEFVLFVDKAHKDKEIVTHGGNVRKVDVWAGNNLISNLFVLPFYAAKYKVDVLLFQNFVSPLGRFRKIAYIHDILFLTHPQYYSTIERLYFAPLKLVTRFAHHIVTVSRSEKSRLLDQGYAKKNEDVSVVYHGISESFKPIGRWHSSELSSFRAKYCLPARYLLFVGRLNTRKNIESLLAAVPLLRDRSIKLVIVGERNWKTTDYGRLVQSLGIEDRLMFIGFLSDNELVKAYALATVFCFPSLAEGFGLPPLEAMASGVPIIVSDRTSLPEVCGEAGTYVDPTDERAIASAIDELLTNEPLYDFKRQEGLQHTQQFTWERASQQLLELFATITKTDNEACSAG